MTGPTLICGMHRSGTSLVAASLEACGLYLGHEHELIAAAEDNPRGFWEHERITSINNRLLATLGGGWDAPPALPETWWRLDGLGGLRDEAREVIDDVGHVEHWGFKDPRLSLVLEFWLDLLPDARLVICIRNPLEVVASLQARNGCSPAHALALWWRYHREIERVASVFPDTCHPSDALSGPPRRHLPRGQPPLPGPRPSSAR